jgi:hypothetical protein
MELFKIFRTLISWRAAEPGLSASLAHGLLVDELRKNSGRLFGQYAVNESSVHTGRMWFCQKRSVQFILFNDLLAK